jgi:hypothetical protein
MLVSFRFAACSHFVCFVQWFCGEKGVNVCAANWCSFPYSPSNSRREIFPYVNFEALTANKCVKICSVSMIRADVMNGRMSLIVRPVCQIDVPSYWCIWRRRAESNCAVSHPTPATHRVA